MIDNNRFQELLEEYKSELKGNRWDDEKFKWQTIKGFQNHWDIEAVDFCTMLKNSLDTKMVTKLTIDSKRLKQVQSLYPSSEYVVSKDKNAYQSSLESIQSMNHMIQILSCSIIVCGLVVLSLVLVLWLRDRIHEIGILLSIGKSKVEIIIQFIFELVFISIPSGIILCAYSVIKHNALCFTLSYGLLMSIIIVSVLIASLMIMIKKPREILSKLS